MKTIAKIGIPLLAMSIWSCAPDQFARVGEVDDIYFASTDRREVPFERLVNNNRSQNFQQYQQANEISALESFSARNVNPDFVARYNNDVSVASLSSDDYFVEGFGAQDVGHRFNSGLGTAGNTTYNNFTVVNRNMGMGMSPFMGNPFFWDPFWDPMWGPGFSTWGVFNTFGPVGAWGMGPGWNRGFSVGFGMGFNTWNSWGMNRMMFGWNRLTPAWMLGGPGMMWGWDPFMWDPWMNPGLMSFYNPWMVGRPIGGWGWNRPFINNGLIVVNRPEVPIRNVVRGPRDGRSSGYGYATNANNNLVPTNQTRSAVAARQGTTGVSTMTGRETNIRAFSTSQNELYSASRRAAMSGYTTSSAVATRNSSNVGTVNSQARRSYVVPQSQTATTRRSANTTNFGRPATTNQGSTINRPTPTAPSRSNSTMMNSRSSSFGSSGSSIGTMSSGGGSRSTMSSGGGASSGGRGGR
jgi:hypothetical protein